MRKLKTISVILVLLGIGLLIYGWFLGKAFSADSRVFERLYTIMLIKKYVFSVSGGILVLIGYITDIVGNELEELSDKVRLDKHK